MINKLTLIELFIVLVLIGILTLVMLPEDHKKHHENSTNNIETSLSEQPQIKQ